MNLMTKILNALAFANIGNQHQFNVLLRQVDRPAVPGLNLAPLGTVSAQADTASVAHGIRHAQGTL
jgi:hypothetical protein